VAVRPVRGAAPRTPADVLEGVLAGLPTGRELVLVPHSNAGLYVPQTTRHRTVVGMVFVDAVLPSRSGGTIPVAPPALVGYLREKVDREGLLPVWTEWWEPDQLAGLFPSDDVRAEVEREQQRLPLSYFCASVDVPSGWDSAPGAYLSFGGTYEDELRDAANRRWPTATLDGGHLHMLVAPDAVATEVSRLLGQLPLTSRPG